MGVGKTFVIKWMAENGVLPLEDFALIDPDRIAQRLPEYSGYAARASASASLMTRLEAGLITELGLVWALQQRRNILVDSSLRHGSWYAALLKRLRAEVPDVRVGLLYVHTSEETIHRRAQDRGRDGRVAILSEVQDSLQKMPRAVGRLLPHVDFFAQVANDRDQPRVTSTCHHASEGGGEAMAATKPSDASGDDDASDGDTCGIADPFHGSPQDSDMGWSCVREFLSHALGGEPAEPLPRPPRILPTSSTREPLPLLQLLRTVVFSASKHRGQTRKDPSRTPYVNHPLAVARILAEVGIRDVATLQVALLHDTLEDTDTTGAELSRNFGPEVAELVESLTDDDSLRPTTRKLRQLRGAQALRYKAKLVRIADKLHNIWDIINHGIPGWTAERSAAYVAWARELVSALKGTHAGLETRFFSEAQEMRLPEGYRLGDWERKAVQQVDEWSWEPLSDLPQEWTLEDNEELAEHKAVLSLLRAAEFVAQQNSGVHGSGHATSSDAAAVGEETESLGAGEGLLRALNVALVLANQSVRDAETLQAALLSGAMPQGLGAVTSSCLDQVRASFGEEVASILRALAHATEQPVGERKASARAFVVAENAEDLPLRGLPVKAKLVVLSQQFYGLKTLQTGGLADERAAERFRELAKHAWRVRRSLTGTSQALEALLDEIFEGQVRLASGELVPVAEVAGFPGQPGQRPGYARKLADADRANERRARAPSVPVPEMGGTRRPGAG